MNNPMYTTKILTGGQIYTPIARLRFAALDKPRAVMGDASKLRYQATLLFDTREADVTEIVRLSEEMALKTFGANWNKIKEFHLPLKDGSQKGKVDEKTGEFRILSGYGEGIWYIDSKSQFVPKLFDRNRTPVDATSFYDGCYVRAIGNLFSYQPSKNNPASKRGIGFGLQGLQFVRDGEPLGSMSVDPDELDDLE